MVQFPVTESLLEGRLSEALVALLDEARYALDSDLGAARQFVERAAALIDRDHAACAEALHSAREGDAREDGAQERGGLAPWQMVRVARYIDANLEASTSNEDLAGQVRLSRSYFSKAFRRSFGLSPHHYVIERRVERAKMLMQATVDPLSQIATACGFSDQAHLARVFRRIAGQAPNLWRRERRGMAAIAISS
jgi:AraC family transcriptional regulator